MSSGSPISAVEPGRYMQALLGYEKSVAFNRQQQQTLEGLYKQVQDIHQRFMQHKGRWSAAAGSSDVVTSTRIEEMAESVRTYFELEASYAAFDIAAARYATLERELSVERPFAEFKQWQGRVRRARESLLTRLGSHAGSDIQDAHARIESLLSELAGLRLGQRESELQQINANLKYLDEWLGKPISFSMFVDWRRETHAARARCESLLRECSAAGLKTAADEIDAQMAKLERLKQRLVIEYRSVRQSTHELHSALTKLNNNADELQQKKRLAWAARFNANISSFWWSFGVVFVIACFRACSGDAGWSWWVLLGPGLFAAATTAGIVFFLVQKDHKEIDGRIDRANKELSQTQRQLALNAQTIDDLTKDAGTLRVGLK